MQQAPISFPCKVSMIDLVFLLKNHFCRIKKDLEYIFHIYNIYLRKLSRLRGQFCSNALVIDTKYCSVLTQYYNTSKSRQIS